jgi:citrate lyase subunit beta/citryl-CoA lyase
MRPGRVALFAPGINSRVMTKAFAAGADAVILDLEDSVPLTGKAEARSLVTAMIDERTPGAGSQPVPTVYVRTNGAATGLLADDLSAVVRPGLDAVMLPKAEHGEEVRNAATEIERLEAARGLPAGSVALVLQIESALGVRNCFDLIKASPRVAGTCFGSARGGEPHLPSGRRVRRPQ